jgi:hypothetical protein
MTCYACSLFSPIRRTILFEIRHSQRQIGFSDLLDTGFSPSPVSARYSAPYRDRLISLVDSIRVVLFLIVPVSQNRGHH